MKIKHYIIISILASASVWVMIVETNNHFNGSLHDMSRCQQEIADIAMSLEKKYEAAPSNGFEMIFTNEMTEDQFQQKVDDCFGHDGYDKDSTK